MAMIARETQVFTEERETYSYTDFQEADLHDKFMIQSGWERIDRYTFESNVYQIFTRKTKHVYFDN